MSADTPDRGEPRTQNPVPVPPSSERDARELGARELDALTLTAALQSGCARLIGARERLNAINVFPVADADTGTNLAFTAYAMLEVLDGETGGHAGRLLTRSADAAIDGARGNSGAIFAQFMLGLADALESSASIHVEEFSRAVSQAARQAREAVSEPREGTILTAMQCFASACAAAARDRAGGPHGSADGSRGRADESHGSADEPHRFAARGRADGSQDVADEPRDPAISFRDLLARALPRVAAAVEATTAQLEPLRKAMVVDAGAQGFLDWLSGIARYLDSGEVERVPAGRRAEAASSAAQPSAAAHAATDTTQRFCAECMVSAEAVDLRQLREAVSALGTSLVIAGNARKARVHLHVNEPEALFQAAARFGAVSDRKADDMQGQQRLARQAGAQRVGILTDSAADLPGDEVHRLNIHVVPLRIHFGERTLIDGVSQSAEDFYREFAVGDAHPKTSQPPAGDFRRGYEFLASHFEEVAAICLSGKMSGTLAAAKSAAARLPATDRSRITVIDSMSASLGEGLLVLDAAELAQAGASAAQIAARVRQMIPHTLAFGLVATLDYAVRGGRLPKSARFIARIIGATPIITMNPDGSAGAGGVLWGRRGLRDKFARFARKKMRTDRRYRVAVGHANAPLEGQALLNAIVADRDNIERADLTTLGAVLGVHGGPGMLLVGIQERPHA